MGWYMVEAVNRYVRQPRKFRRSGNIVSSQDCFDGPNLKVRLLGNLHQKRKNVSLSKLSYLTDILYSS